MMPLYVGGCVRALAERGGQSESENDPGVLAASGLVAGEGLAGVGVAGLVAFDLAPKSMAPRLAGLAGETAAVATALLVCFFLYRARAASGLTPARSS